MSRPRSTITVVFSIALRERLLEAVKNPMPVRLLSTFVKLGGVGCGIGTTVLSPTS